MQVPSKGMEHNPNLKADDDHHHGDRPIDHPNLMHLVGIPCDPPQCPLQGCIQLEQKRDEEEQ